MVSDFLPRTVSTDGGREVKVAVPRSDNRSGVVLRLLPGAFTRLADDTSVSRAAPAPPLRRFAGAAECS